MKVVIVESPTKAKTIQQYLGKDFTVLSSYGHVRDLPKKEMGVNTATDFKPKYVIPLAARSRVSQLKKAVSKASEIFFATDEDREGEAIAWHLREALKPDASKVKRITFEEITKAAILRAMEQPRKIDINLVNAQQARRVLDRLVGYELSPLLWKKVRRGLSAGRVQSVAVRLIAEREQAITAFKPDEYWTITALLQKNNQQFPAEVSHERGQPIAKLGIPNKVAADHILQQLQGASYIVHQVKQQEHRRTPPPPFTTSSLQQAAVNQLGFSTKKTMVLAQQLYEGVSLGSKGLTGLITYMRTDSVHVSSEAQTFALNVILQLFGTRYALAAPRHFSQKAKGAQEAHEAIRPTDPSLLPADTKQYLDNDQWKLYQLIWQRLMASQMPEAQMSQMTVLIAAQDYYLRARGSTITFDGFLKVLGKNPKEVLLPPLKEHDTLTLYKLSPEQHFTEPPPRFSEATLVKALEEEGIGRPSTYAPTIDVIQQRGYVTKGEDKRFRPTDTGLLVNKLLTEHFPDIVDIGFTATMENNLDEIAAGQKQWQPVIKDFYQPFHKQITKKESELKKKELTQEPTGQRCPKCQQGEVVIKLGRFGRFRACTNFPACKYAEPVAEDARQPSATTTEICPTCGKPLVVRHGRFGPFLGCSGYPTCKYIKNISVSTGISCPTCKQGELVARKTKRGRPFYSCNRYPDCTTAYWSKPTGEFCPRCGQMMVMGAKSTTRCSSKTCEFSKQEMAA